MLYGHRAGPIGFNILGVHLQKRSSRCAGLVQSAECKRLRDPAAVPGGGGAVGLVAIAARDDGAEHHAGGEPRLGRCVEH